MRLIRYLTFDPFLFMQDQHEMPLSLKCLQYGKMGESLVFFYRCAWALGLSLVQLPVTCSAVPLNHTASDGKLDEGLGMRLHFKCLRWEIGRYMVSTTECNSFK